MFTAISLPTIMLIATSLVLIAMLAVLSAVERSSGTLTGDDIKFIRSNEGERYKAAAFLMLNPQLLRQATFAGKSVLSLSVLAMAGLLPLTDKSLTTVAAAIVALYLLALIVPTRLAPKYSMGILLFTARPVSKIAKLTGRVSKDAPSNDEEESVHDVEELETMIEASSDTGSTHQKDLLKSIVRFGDKTVADVMTPRADVVCLELGKDFESVIRLIVEENYSRIPVLNAANDRIQGIVYIKDLLPHISESAAYNWQQHIRQAYFVPESKMIDDLLHEFQKEKVHIAVVIDEYGSMSGIVTMEDILEEIVGEINDEYDEETHNVVRLNEKEFIFEGKTPLEELTETLGLAPDFFGKKADEAETVAGLVLSLLDGFPELHQQIGYGNLRFEVLRMDERRISKIKISIEGQKPAEKN